MTREEAVEVLKERYLTCVGIGLDNHANRVNEAIDMAIEALSAEDTTGDYPNDLISRSALMEYCSNQKSKSIDNNDIARFPSAEARPTVIRSRTLLPTKDFKEWAKRIREVNPNAVVIPCDAEVASAEARPTGEWIPVSERLPNIGDTFLVTVMVGTRIKTDVASNFGSYIDGFWDTFNDWIEDEECHVTAWMPLPEPYKGGEEE